MKTKTILRTIGLLLSALTLLSFASCSLTPKEDPAVVRTKAAFDLSKQAYDNVKDAYAITGDFGHDIYNAWNYGIQKNKNATLSGLAEETNLTLEELRMGYVKWLHEDEWETMSDSEKQEKKEQAESDFKLAVNYVLKSVFSACVDIVSASYEANGKTAEAQKSLDEAKGIMKDLSANYSDYEHYPSLKGYYTNTVSYFEFCKEPEGTFEQLKGTIEEYRNKARDYASDLDYIFED